MRATRKLFPFDVLFGNWACLDVENCDELVKSSSYARTQDGQIVRLCMDRALGCTYPEDRKKTDKHIIEFSEGSSMEELKFYLKAGPQNWLYGEINEFLVSSSIEELKLYLNLTVTLPYGEITENMFLHGCMDMDLTEKGLHMLKKSFEISEGLPWDDLLTHKNLETVLISRLDQLRNWLPYFEIESVSTKVRIMSFGQGVK